MTRDPDGGEARSGGTPAELKRTAFAFLRAHAAEYLEDLITEFDRELDHGMRCWLLELVGEARL